MGEGLDSQVANGLWTGFGVESVGFPGRGLPGGQDSAVGLLGQRGGGLIGSGAGKVDDIPVTGREPPGGFGLEPAVEGFGGIGMGLV